MADERDDCNSPSLAVCSVAVVAAVASVTPCVDGAAPPVKRFREAAACSAAVCSRAQISASSAVCTPDATDDAEEELEDVETASRTGTTFDRLEGWYLPALAERNWCPLDAYFCAPGAAAAGTGDASDRPNISGRGGAPGAVVVPATGVPVRAGSGDFEPKGVEECGG